MYSLYSNTTASNNTAVGYQAAYSNTAQSITALGYKAGYSNTTGTDNVAIGDSALYTNTTAANNTAVGRYALYFSTGGSNTALGYNAAYSTSSGANNVAVGTSALYSNTTASSNTALGYQAAYSNTTGSLDAFGYQALYSNTTGGSSYSNTAMGYRALYSNTTGQANTALGGVGSSTNSAMYANTTGSYNTAVGNQALRSNTTADNNTAVGYQAGFSITGTGNTCLGTLAGQDTAPITSGTNNTILGAFCRPSSGTDNNEIVIGYNVSGVGSTTVTLGSASGKIYNSYASSATWTQTSDVRLKTNVQDDSLGLSFINRLRPVKFNWKASNEIDQSLPYYNEVNERDTTTVIHGLIAQEVKEALDAEGVDTFAGWDEGPDGIQAISREMFISPLIKAVQELKTELDAAKAEIAALKGQA
jgi:hypothetical protein